MISAILIVFFSLILLLALHEFGHFFAAKRFGVRVEEFGIGYPPRIFGKKIGETLYSLNLLPFGAFVRIKDEEISKKPIWQRAIVLVSGVVSFWLVAFLIFSFLAVFFGIPTTPQNENEYARSQIKIIGVAKNSPAEKVGIKIGDTIKAIKTENGEVVDIKNAKNVQDFIQEHKGERIILVLERGKKPLEIEIVPRVSPPEGQGAMGVVLLPVVLKKYPLSQAFIKGGVITFKQTQTIVLSLVDLLKKLIQREKTPEVELLGPIGIGHLMTQSFQAGTANFLMLLAMISLWLAVFNLLPIPALDGGQILFLGIEKIRGKPLNKRIEEKITTVFFLALLVLVAIATVKDISRIF